MHQIRKITYSIIEEDGKLYAFRIWHFRGQAHELFQRLETRESQPRKMWYGTKIAADHQAAKAAAFRAELAAFRAGG